MYWFLYRTDGSIGEVRKIAVEEWTNLNGYAGAYSVPEERTDLVTWQASSPFNDGDTLSTGGYYYTCTAVSATPPSPSLSGATEPTWPTTIGATVVDNDLTWTCEAVDESVMAEDAFVHKNYYTVEVTPTTQTVTNPDGTTSTETVNVAKLTKTVTDAQLLADAKTAQIALLGQSLEEQYLKGFTSSATGTSLTYPFDPVSQNKWSWMMTVSISGVYPTGGIQVKDINGNVYNITDTTVAKNLATDAMNFYLQWDSHFHSLLNNVASATTVAAVQAVIW